MRPPRHPGLTTNNLPFLNRSVGRRFMHRSGFHWSGPSSNGMANPTRIRKP